jgi:hypothetical protein
VPLIRQGPFCRSAISHKRRDSPGENDEQSDEWDVGVAVGPGLLAHLHKSDYGDERAQIPEPSGYHVREPPRGAQGSPGYGSQKQDRSEDLPGLPKALIGIEDGEIGRPEHFSM